MNVEHFEQHYVIGSPYHEWVVMGDAGAVSFLVFPQEKTDSQETACTIGIHARRASTVAPKRGRCDVLPDGHCFEQAKDQGAHELWVLSGHGDNTKMIWEVLTSWYRATWA